MTCLKEWTKRASREWSVYENVKRVFLFVFVFFFHNSLNPIFIGIDSHEQFIFKLFNKYDKDKSNSIDKKELKKIMLELQIMVKETRIKDTLKELKISKKTLTEIMF